MHAISSHSSSVEYCVNRSRICRNFFMSDRREGSIGLTLSFDSIETTLEETLAGGTGIAGHFSRSKWGRPFVRERRAVPILLILGSCNTGLSLTSRNESNVHLPRRAFRSFQKGCARQPLSWPWPHERDMRSRMVLYRSCNTRRRPDLKVENLYVKA